MTSSITAPLVPLAPPVLGRRNGNPLEMLTGTRDLVAYDVFTVITCGNRSQDQRTNRLANRLNPVDREISPRDRPSAIEVSRPHCWRPFAPAHSIAKQTDGGLLNNLDLLLGTVEASADPVTFLLELEFGCLGAQALLSEEYWGDPEADYIAQQPVAEKAGVALVEYIAKAMRGRRPVRVITVHTSGFMASGEATTWPYETYTS